jgi:hypothetical protein
MYIDQILTYLVWPVFILVSWLIIRSAVILYEKKSGGTGKNAGDS